MELKNKIVVKCKSCKIEFNSTIRYKGKPFKHCKECLKKYRKKYRESKLLIVRNKKK